MIIESISHCSDKEFADIFRRDLANAAESVIIFSPFLSKNRISFYHPVFSALGMRGVGVQIYCRPKEEQPMWLIEHYDGNMRLFDKLGLQCHILPGMHEKLAIIDKELLWHGSLNILSHNDGRESMLRFGSKDLVAEIMSDLGIESECFAVAELHETSEEQLAEDAQEASPTSEKQCPVCGKAMKWFGRAALWICEDAPRCDGTISAEALNGSTETVGQRPESFPDFQVPCPICGAPMDINRGVFIRLACPASRCRFVMDHRLSAWIVRTMRRKLAL